MNMYLPVGPNSGTVCEVSHGRHPSTEAARTLLTALKLRGVGPVGVRKFVGNLRPDDILSPNLELFQKRGLSCDAAAIQRAANAADAVIDVCEEKNIAIICTLDAGYPKRLKCISDAPPVIYVKGDLSSIAPSGCAVVGTRQASDFGLKIAYRISLLLCKRGLSVVSGLALGIDTAAHEGALSGDGVTIAIMAHGLDTVAPASNRKLAARILEQGGALISEHEPGVPARPAEFVRRNRIQSGMSLCSIIVESGQVGGSMHQARFTLSQGKPVLAILPENADGALRDFNHDGGELLVKEYGAARVRNTDELMKQIDVIVQKATAQSAATQNTLAV